MYIVTPVSIYIEILKKILLMPNIYSTEQNRT